MSIRRRRLAACLAAAILLVVLGQRFAVAQSAQPAASQVSVVELTGTVTDSSGAAVPSAAIRLDLEGASPLATVSGPGGEFRLPGVPPGLHVVTVAHKGFATETIAWTAGTDAPVLTIALQPAGVAELVTVSATRVETPVSTIPNTVTIIDTRTLSQRTAISDDLASTLEANVPGFAPGLKKLSGRGETLRGRNPLYLVNGVPQHTPLRDGERDGHTIDLDFVERIEVIHGSNAIQGIGATGGVVNLVTRKPRSSGEWTHDVKFAVGTHDSFDDRGLSAKLAYLIGKKVGRLDVTAGASVHTRGLFFDANGDPVGLYPTQGDIMDSTSRNLYARAGFDVTSTRRAEITVNDFRLSRDGDYVSVPGNRALGRLTGTMAGDPRPVVGDPARNESTSASFEYRDKALAGGEAVVQGYVHDFYGLFEGGSFTTFALTTGGPAFLDQSAITSRKWGAKATWALPTTRVFGLVPTVGLDIAHDESAQELARTGRTWVPATTLREIAPFVQVQRTLFSRVFVNAGVRYDAARVGVDDFTTLPSSRSTFVRGGRPTFDAWLPNIGAVVTLSPTISVYGSYSEGFTMPDVGRVLRAVTTPNLSVHDLVDIEPVRAGNVEVGIDRRAAGFTLHASYYRSTSERGSLLERTADNVFRVRRQPTTIQGVDLGASATFAGGWILGGTYAFLDGRFDSNNDGTRDSDLDGLNIAPNRLTFHVDGAPLRSVTMRLQVSRAFDRGFDGLATVANRNFDGYTTVDLSTGWATRIGTLRLGIENLLDVQYVTYFSQTDPVAGVDNFFAGPGRSLTFAIERRF